MPSVRRNLGAELAALYLGTVLAVFVVERSTSLVDPAGLASSPAALAAGKVWTLLTSGFLIASGFLAEQVPAFDGYVEVDRRVEDNWVAIALEKTA